MTRLTYSIITPARDEASALPRLAASLDRQTKRPQQWIIAENGSKDDTAAVAGSLEATHEWAHVIVVPEDGQRERGAPIVRALHAGFAALDPKPDIVVNVDADVTVEPDYFEQLLDAFERDTSLGIASGSAWEIDGGAWGQRFVTGGTVWGATRAYRWACLQDVLPLEERHGWDGVDQLKARARGWRTVTFTDLAFRHHRGEGTRDGSSWAHWRVNGDTAYFMGYRPLSSSHALTFDETPPRSGSSSAICRQLSRRSARMNDPDARAVLHARSEHSIAPSPASAGSLWRRRRPEDVIR